MFSRQISTKENFRPHDSGCLSWGGAG